MNTVQQAFTNFLLWLSWYPADYAGAVTFASDYLETEQDVNDFQAMIEEATL